MHNNITREDRQALADFLLEDRPLTQSAQVRHFEAEWSDWLGVKFSVFVNSGASANLLTMAALRHLFGVGEVIVPPLTWVSDIASVLHCGLTPVFADVDYCTLGLDTDQVLPRLSEDTRAVFLTHILGYNALDPRLLDALKNRNIPLIEDVCESHGATFRGKKLGTFGFISNFSFYYAHHMTTIEGGMICTDNEEVYEFARMARSHGLVRESTSPSLKTRFEQEHPDLDPQFIFAMPAYNVRSTELNAVLGRNQLKSLDHNNQKRRENLALFLASLDSRRYRTDFNVEGSVNYAFTLVLREPDTELRDAVASALRDANVEFRRGLSGGGNQLRQPYLRKHLSAVDLRCFPNVEHLHFFGFYLGNYPSLEREKIIALCDLLNRLTPARRHE